MRLRPKCTCPCHLDVTTLSAAVSTRRLLVVEDDDSIRETVREALRAEGFEVKTCADGASALNLITAETSDPPDLKFRR